MNSKKTVYKYITIMVVLTAIAFGISVFTIKRSEPPANTGNLNCTIKISCENILKNSDILAEEKKEIIPENGIVLDTTEVSFNEGETAFDILKNVVSENKIQIEFSGEADSAYVEGIANIYNFDCGEMSGWLYKVNGEAADKSAAQYIVNENDVIEWVYSCDMGNDI